MGQFPKASDLKLFAVCFMGRFVIKLEMSTSPMLGGNGTGRGECNHCISS